MVTLLFVKISLIHTIKICCRKYLNFNVYNQLSFVLKIIGFVCYGNFRKIFAAENISISFINLEV